MSDNETMDMSGVPTAAYTRIYFCVGPDCNLPHVVLFDDNDKPIAQFVPMGDGFLNDMIEATENSARLIASRKRPS
jgi:hypothetical protein